jgi:hypothetical protein
MEVSSTSRADRFAVGDDQDSLGAQGSIWPENFSAKKYLAAGSLNVRFEP